MLVGVFRVGFFVCLCGGFVCVVCFFVVFVCLVCWLVFLSVGQPVIRSLC